MEESILKSIKKLLGILNDDTSFDIDILMHLNTVLAILKQIGLITTDTLVIEDDVPRWRDLLGDTNEFALIRSYVYTKVRLLFDPPTSSFGLASMQEQANMLEWRIYTLLDQPFVEPVVLTDSEI